jgi:hypothetical protein
MLASHVLVKLSASRSISTCVGRPLGCSSNRMPSLSIVGSLSWERLENRKASRIADYISGDVQNVNDHVDYVDWFVDTGDRLRKAVGKIDTTT